LFLPGDIERNGGESKVKGVGVKESGRGMQSEVKMALNNIIVYQEHSSNYVEMAV
jgi:hypothetical protein